jgi:large subunit ribosomal protein L22
MATGNLAPVEPLEGAAVARYVRVSPQKARLVINLIRGAGAEQALQVLASTRKRVSRDIEKVLRSAIANVQRKAEDSGSPLDVDHLYVSRCMVDPGPTVKRFRGAPFGRAHRYVHRTSHIAIAVAEHAGSAVRRAQPPTTTRGRVRKAIDMARQQVKKREKEKAEKEKAE